MVSETERLRAEFYDARTDERADVEYYLDLASSADGPVLEVACGTGRIYLPLLENGVDVDGFDLSAASLSLLRERALDAGLEPTVWQADMTAVTVDRAYALAYCPFNSLQFLRTADDQLATLTRIYDALAPGGSFVFDVFVPSFELVTDTYGEWQSELVEFRGESYQHRTRSQIIDEPRQRFVVASEARTADGEQLFSVENHLTMLPATEVDLLARLSPFESWSATGDFTDEPLDDGHSLQVWELRKGQESDTTRPPVVETTIHTSPPRERRVWNLASSDSGGWDGSSSTAVSTRDTT